MSEFQCRTKPINGTTYMVFCYQQDGKLSARMTLNSLESAESMIEKMNSINVRAELVTKPWTKEVCIECGEERF